jgi:tRNA-Thr(GGU) m(6)t(6)A37 methyltransferase TsaA
MNQEQIIFTPIGKITSPFESQEGTPIQGKMAPEKKARVEIFPDFAKGLKDLDGFSHIYLLYKFDRVGPGDILTKPYLDTEKRGIFATRSPRRPNPIGLTIVKIEKVNSDSIDVSGVDLLNNTPIIDIKPYIPDFDEHKDVKIGWYGKNPKRQKLVLADDRFAK